ncbi:unnamed protein product [Closterium sp. Naga37s-1]|nr:unnamed protein product [Closterium sp. Naga37s-1]
MQRTHISPTAVFVPSPHPHIFFSLHPLVVPLLTLQSLVFPSRLTLPPSGTNRHHKRAAAYLVKAVSRHAGAELAEAGVLPLLTECLLDAMLAVRETAACALGHVAKHSGDMAMRVVETGAVRLLVTCLQDEAVARIALSVLSDVARHSLLHTTAVADAGGITAAVALLGSPDVKTRRQVCVCLSTIARHSESLALQVLDQPGASRLLLCLHDSSPSLRASAAAAVREVARQGPAAAGRLVGMGGIGPLLDAVGTWRDAGEGEGMTKGSAKVSVVVALGFLAASSPDAALAVVASDGISPLQDLIVEGHAHVTLKGACAWALSQMASHGPSHAKAVSDSGVLIDMVTAATVHLPAPNPAAEPAVATTADGAAVTPTASDARGSATEARERLVRAVKDVVVRLNDIEALDALLQVYCCPSGSCLHPPMLPSLTHPLIVFSPHAFIHQCCPHSHTPLLFFLLMPSSTNVALTHTPPYCFFSSCLHPPMLPSLTRHLTLPAASKPPPSLACVLLPSPLLLPLPSSPPPPSSVSPIQWTKLPDGILESVLHRMSLVLAKDNACRPAFLASNGFTRLQRLLQLAEAKRAAAAADAAANAAASAAADGANAESPGDRAAKVTRFDPASVRCIEGGVDWDLVEDHVSSINSLFPFEVSQFYSADYQQHLLQKLSDSVKPEWAAIATAAASPRAMSIKAREGRFVRGGRRPVDVEEVGRGGWEAPDLGPVMEEEGEGEEDGGEEDEGEMGEGGTGGDGDGGGLVVENVRVEDDGSGEMKDRSGGVKDEIGKVKAGNGRMTDANGERNDGNGGRKDTNRDMEVGNGGMKDGLDIISAIEFDRSGEHLATGDRGGRVVLFDRIDLRDARGRREMEASDYPPAAHQQIDYRYSTEFQSHEPEFDYLKSLEIEEKINKIRWVNSSQGALYVLSTNDKTIKLWRVTERRVKAVSQFNCPPRTAADYLASANAPADPAAAADAVPTPPVSVPGGAQINPRYLPRPGSLSAASATARAVAAGAGAVLNGVGEGMDLDFPPGGFPQLRLPAVVSTNETTLVARCRRVFSNAHAYHINSISCNSDRETFISADDLRVNLWNLENNSQSFNVVDIKPANMEDLTEVITCAEFHPSHCHSLAYSTSKGTIRLIDMRQSALCDQHSKLFEEQEPPGNRSFFSEIIASISDVKFSNDGRYIFSRDYMTVKLWDIHMEAQPLGTFKVHEFLRPKLCDLYENDCIFDKFECTPSGDGLRCASGSYSNLFRVFGVVPGSDEASLLESSKTPNRHQPREGAGQGHEAGGMQEEVRGG